MESRTVTAAGDRTWDWPCLHVQAEELVKMEVAWETEAGETLALPTDGTPSVLYLPAEGSGSDNAVTVSDELLVEADKLTIEDLDISALKGVYRARLLIADSEENTRYSLPFILSVTGSWALTSELPPCIEDIRMTMADRLASENLIVGGQEVSDRIIFDGVCQAVRMWNDMDPVLQGYSTTNFPNAGKLREGAAGYAFRQHAIRLGRNRTQGGGFDGNQRADLYLGLAQEFVGGYLSWLVSYKQKLDVDNGWGYA